MAAMRITLKLNYSNVLSCSFSLLHKDTTPHGLRKVHIPGELISHFLRLASDNTRKNLETCGILAGRLVSSTVSFGVRDRKSASQEYVVSISS